jgi:hypothetical protein
MESGIAHSLNSSKTQTIQQMNAQQPRYRPNKLKALVFVRFISWMDAIPI